MVDAGKYILLRACVFVLLMPWLAFINKSVGKGCWSGIRMMFRFVFLFFPALTATLSLAS